MLSTRVAFLSFHFSNDEMISDSMLSRLSGIYQKMKDNLPLEYRTLRKISFQAAPFMSNNEYSLAPSTGIFFIMEKSTKHLKSKIILGPYNKYLDRRTLARFLDEDDRSPSTDNLDVIDFNCCSSYFSETLMTFVERRIFSSTSPIQRITFSILFRYS